MSDEKYFLTRNTKYPTTISYNIKEFEKLKLEPPSTVIKVHQHGKFIGKTEVSYVLANSKQRTIKETGEPCMVSKFLLKKNWRQT